MDGPRRRDVLRAATAGAAGLLAGCTGGSGDATPTDDDGGTSTDGGGTGPTPTGVPDGVGVETLADGFAAPVDVVFVPGADRRYVADQPGQVWVHGPDGLADEPLLDLGDAVTYGGEMGLLGVALHPSFPEDRRLFVRYSAPPRGGTPAGYSHTFVLASVRVAADGRSVVPGSERSVLEIPEPQSNHNAGDLAFGPDGHLYVPVGDGGAGGDQGPGHVEDWYGAVAGGNGQDVRANLLGSILRIDVSDPAGYAVPEDNPLVGRPGRDEHWAWGLRNPWRLAFDGEDLFVGDVGQRSYEEVDLVERGGNYGWNVREGRHCYGADDCPSATPEDIRGGEPLLAPILEYPHSGAPVSGISVIGGEVYRGDALPGLAGAYVFGDLQAGGDLFVATRPDGGEWAASVLPVVTDGVLSRVLSFGRAPDGEVYVLGSAADGGGLHRLVPA